MKYAIPHPLAAALILLLTGAAAAQPRASFPRAYRGDGVSLNDATTHTDFFPIVVNHWWGEMDQVGVMVVYPQFQWADYSFDSYIRVVTHGKTGFISGGYQRPKRGGGAQPQVWLIQPVLPYADRFAEKRAIIGDGEGHFGFMDKTGKIVVPVKLDGALRFHDDLAAVRVGKRIGFINRTGGATIAPQFIMARSFRDGMAVVQLPGHEANVGLNANPNIPRGGPLEVINKAGQVLFIDKQRQLRDMAGFYDNLARAQLASTGKWGYLNQLFHFQIPAQFDDARDFHNGLAAVKHHGKWGYINKIGRLVVPFRYDTADDFDDTLAMVSRRGKFGYIDKVGREVIAPQFDWAEPFFRDYARVAQPPNFGYIDTAGNVIWDPRAPLVRITDVRNIEQGRLAVTPPAIGFPGNLSVELPKPRKKTPAPYPPEYQYEPVLKVKP